MNSGTTASLICPACGQAFLSMQQSMEGMVQCPHCAHNALRGYFGTHAQVAGVAQVRRRVSQAQPPPAPAPPQPPQLQNPQSISQPAAWPGLQPLQASTNFVVRPTLQHSLALQPTGAPPPPHEEFTTPSHLRTSPWRNAFIMLSFAVVCGGALWLWWDSGDVPAVKPGVVALPPPAPVEVQKAQIADKTEIARALIPPPDTVAIAADAKVLVNQLFAADSAAGRAACIQDAGKYSAEIEALFGATGAEKTELLMITRIPGMPVMLPGGQQVPLFKLTTSTCPKGALLRLETGADGKRRISWPLLYETHAATLAAFLQQPDAAPAWFHVGLRPSHGLDLAAELRPKYITFDLQASAAGDPHFVACVERNTPLGRYLDRETEWGMSYLSRLLVRKLDIQSSAPCLLVIDCEGAHER